MREEEDDAAAAVVVVVVAMLPTGGLLLALSLSRHLSPPSRSLPLPMDAQRTSLLLLGTPRLELISSFSEKERGEAMEKKKKVSFFDDGKTDVKMIEKLSSSLWAPLSPSIACGSRLRREMRPRASYSKAEKVLWEV